MHEGFIQIYKKQGETPLDCINNLKKERSELAGMPMTYAGRLDPMAEGLLLILVGDECLKKDEYLNLDKEYEVEVLFGFETDTYDLLGRILNASSHTLFERSSDLLSEQVCSAGQTISNNVYDCALVDSKKICFCSLNKILQKFVGDIEQKYPPYSSKPVDGKPLFVWAREGNLDKIKIPTHKVHIESIDILEQRKINKEDLQKYIKNSISKVNGDFRQEEILNNWEEALSENKNEVFDIVKIKVLCGSGTYMRTLTHDIGKSLGTSALAFHIKRTKIGNYKI